MLQTESQNEEKLFSGVLRFKAKVFGLILGLFTGLVIFIATNWLVIKGVQRDHHGAYVVGPHLQLLGQFFIGYRVSFLGSIIGFAYGFALGSLGGTLIGYIYNWIVDRRNR